MADTTITVTVATGTQYLVGGSGNVYYFDGSQPGSFTFPWVQGATVRLDQSASSNDNHPLIFTTSNSTSTATMRSGIISSGVTYYLDGSSNQSDYTNTTTFNAATTRYIEIDPASASDFYFACWVHGISMGGIVDVTSNTWGALKWGENDWGEQGDESVTLTGLAITVAENAAGVVPAFNPGWGTLDWGENGWGSVEEGIENLIGIGATSSVGSLTLEIGVPLTGVSATVSCPTQLDIPQLITGVSATASEGQLNISDGSDHVQGLATLVATSAVGSILPADIIGLSGVSATASVGPNMQVDDTVVVDLTGLCAGATSSVGAIVPDGMALGISGVSCTSSVGSISPAEVMGLTGVSATVTVGDAVPLGYLDIDITGNTSYNDVDVSGNTSYTDVTHAA